MSLEDNIQENCVISTFVANKHLKKFVTFLQYSSSLAIVYLFFNRNRTVQSVSNDRQFHFCATDSNNFKYVTCMSDMSSILWSYIMQKVPLKI